MSELAIIVLTTVSFVSSSYFLGRGFSPKTYRFRYLIVLVVLASLGIVVYESPLLKNFPYVFFPIGLASLIAFYYGRKVKYSYGETIFMKNSLFHSSVLVESNEYSKTLALKLNNKLAAAINLFSKEPVSSLLRLFYLVFLIRKPKKILFIGGGPCALPTFVFENIKDIKIDVAEIDPVVARAAREYFFIPQNKYFNLEVNDGYKYINNAGRLYDIVFVDAGINLTLSSKLQNNRLYNAKAIESYKRILGTNGVLAINLMSSLEKKDYQKINRHIQKFSKYFRYQAIFVPDRNSEAARLRDFFILFYNKPISWQKLRRRVRMNSSVNLLNHDWFFYENLLSYLFETNDF